MSRRRSSSRASEARQSVRVVDREPEPTRTRDFDGGLDDTSRPALAIFLGAGASKAFGYPLTRELLPMLLEGLRAKTLFRNFNGPAPDAQDRELLRTFLRELVPGAWSVPSRDLPNVTDLVSLLDHSLSIGEVMVRGRGASDVGQFRHLIGMALFDLLDGTGDRPRVQSRFLAWLMRAEGDGPIGIVTTNYDVAVDRQLFALYEREGEIDEGRVAEDLDFGFEWRSPYTGQLHARPRRPRFRYFKLHGSLNSLRCPLCGTVYINVETEIGGLAYARDEGAFNTCHCGHARLESNLVAPSYVRDVRDTSLLAVWRSALELLRTSPRWIIAGYSLPPEDIGIRSLLVRAYQGRERRPEIEVVQKGTECRSRYALFFPECAYRSAGLGDFLSRKRRRRAGGG